MIVIMIITIIIVILAVVLVLAGGIDFLLPLPKTRVKKVSSFQWVSL